ncbi:MAG: hypothetical protein ABIP55_06590 [Tepidisphaeraceae bacterium]
MLRPLGKIIGLIFLLLAASGGALYYQHAYSTEKKIEKLQDEKRQLEQVVTRLGAETRVADILVSEQKQNERGVLETTLLFVEYDKEGQALPARSFTIDGNTAHIDAMVIKFDQGYVAENDPLRGHSIALFTKIYGDHQSPADAMMIDSPGKIPEVYRGASPQLSQFETTLWNDFWKLYDDESYRKSKGVRALGGHGVWGPFQTDRLYTITIESDGGLNMTSEPLKGIYREAMKHRFPTTAPAPTG